MGEVTHVEVHIGVQFKHAVVSSINAKKHQVEMGFMPGGIAVTWDGAEEDLFIPYSNTKFARFAPVKTKKQSDK